MACKTQTMECAPKGVPTNKTEYIYTWTATLNGDRAINCQSACLFQVLRLILQLLNAHEAV